MSKSKVFIGSSSEGLTIANTLKTLLEKEYEVVIWKDIFTPGDYTLDSLLKQKDKCDFAVLIATPDDERISRGQRAKIPRDNIIFELGLFIGCIGKERTIIVSDNNVKIKLPSDILGINTLTFSTIQEVTSWHKIIRNIFGNYKKLNDQDWLYILKKPSADLCTLMEELGPLKKVGQLEKEKPLKKGPFRAEIQAFVPKITTFELLKSYPSDGQTITTKDVENIYLKFNNPVDKSTVPYIGNYFVQTNSFCQWNICGWIQFAENDTKLIWHIHEKALSNKNHYGPLEIDYPRFEIHIGREPDEWRVKDIHGNELPKTDIKVYIK